MISGECSLIEGECSFDLGQVHFYWVIIIWTWPLYTISNPQEKPWHKLDPPIFWHSEDEKKLPVLQSSGPPRGSSGLIKEEIKKRQRVAVGNKGTSSQVGRTVSAQSPPCASTTPYDNYASEKIVFALVYFLYLYLYLYPTHASYPWEKLVMQRDFVASL